MANVLNLAKQVFNLAQDVKNIELQRAVAELNLELAQMTQREAELTMEIADLKKQLHTTQTNELRKLEFRHGKYYDGEEGPFCPGCHDGTTKVVRLVEVMSVLELKHGNWKCSVCDRYFK